MVLIVFFLDVDVVADVVDLTFPLLDGGVKLHRLLCSMLQILLEVGDLAGQFTLRRSVLGVLLFDLRQVLELDSLSLEDTALHILDELLLLLTEQFVLELHSVDLFFHSNDLSLSNSWIESVLHLFLKLILAFPKEDLLLSFDDLNQDVTLLLLALGDLVLELDRLVFHLLQLLLKLHLDVEVIICKLLLALIVLIDEIIELIHLEDLVLLGDFELSDLLVVALDLGIYSDFLLVEDRLLGAEVIILAVDFVLLFLALDELDLVGDPVLLDVGCLVVDLLDLLLDVVAVVLDRADELVTTISTTLQVGTLTVQTIDLQSFLLDSQQAGLDRLLDLLHVSLLLLELTDEVIELLLENTVLGGGVEVIKSDTRDFVGVVLDLDLLLGDVLVSDLGLFQQVGRGLLNSLLLGGVGDDIVPNSLGLGVQLHDAFVEDIVLGLHVGLFLVHAG